MTTRLRLLWLVPAVMVLHNAEEAMFFPRYLPLVLARLPESWKPLAGAMTLGQMWTALLLVTLVPVALAAWATLRPGDAVPVWLLLLVQATLLLNALWHVCAAILIFNGRTRAGHRGAVQPFRGGVSPAAGGERRLGEPEGSLGVAPGGLPDARAGAVGVSLDDGAVVTSYLIPLGPVIALSLFMSPAVAQTAGPRPDATIRPPHALA